MNMEIGVVVAIVAAKPTLNDLVIFTYLFAVYMCVYGVFVCSCFFLI